MSMFGNVLEGQNLYPTHADSGFCNVLVEKCVNLLYPYLNCVYLCALEEDLKEEDPSELVKME